MITRKLILFSLCSFGLCAEGSIDDDSVTFEAPVFYTTDSFFDLEEFFEDSPELEEAYVGLSDEQREQFSNSVEQLNVAFLQAFQDLLTESSPQN